MQQKECQLCKKGFGFFTFKYACNACGNYFCSGCSNYSTAIAVEDVIDKGNANVVAAAKKPLKCCKPCFNRIQDRKNKKTVDEKKSNSTPTREANPSPQQSKQDTASVKASPSSPQIENSKIPVEQGVAAMVVTETPSAQPVSQPPVIEQSTVVLAAPALPPVEATQTNTVSSPPLSLAIQNPQSSASNDSFTEKYVMGKVLGEGAFAVVKEGIRRQDNTQVAIKIINRAKLSRVDENAISQEVKILSSVEHPNIVKLYEFYDEPGQFFMVMECIQGGELFDRIVKKTTYSEKEARDLAIVLLKTLQFLHERNIVHRDLKPENLLLTNQHDDAEIKLVDFGFAVQVDGFSCDEKVGTPGYISPEILEGKKYGKPTDMWSFGVILYILLGGYPPFYDADSQVLYKKIMKGSFQFHHEYWLNISNGAKDLIRNLLVTNPYARYNVNDCLNHPWITAGDSELSARNLNANLAQLKKFQATKKLKAGVKAVMAVNKFRKLTGSLKTGSPTPSSGSSSPTPDAAATTATSAASAVSTPKVTIQAPEPVVDNLHSRYAVGKVLGEGGYAVVKLGTSKVTKDEVAIKILDRKKMTQKHEDGLRVEVAILQALNHPNIVRAIDFFEDPAAYYVIMELICGGELFDRIVKKTCYTEKEARDLTKVLLGAIKYMHDNQIVHRDLKPENLMLTSESNDADVKIVDFGFAAKVTGANLTTHCGTPGYLAPEILQNIPYGLTVDMWSFGVILYILLGGYPPFYDKNNQLLYRKIVRGVYHFHDDYWGQVSNDAKDLIRHLLVVNPADRYTVDQALAHPWLHVDECHLKHQLSMGLSELKKFQIRKKLRTGMKAVLSVARMRLLVQKSRNSNSVKSNTSGNSGGSLTSIGEEGEEEGEEEKGNNHEAITGGGNDAVFGVEEDHATAPVPITAAVDGSETIEVDIPENAIVK